METTTTTAAADALGKYADSAKRAYDAAAAKLAYAAYGWHKSTVRYPDIFKVNPFAEDSYLRDTVLAFESANLEWTKAVDEYCAAVDAEAAEWEATH